MIDHKWTPRVLAGLRILAGAMFACHGAQKVLGAFGGMPPGAPQTIVWIAGPIEFFGGGDTRATDFFLRRTAASSRSTI